MSTFGEPCARNKCHVAVTAHSKCSEFAYYSPDSTGWMGSLPKHLNYERFRVVTFSIHYNIFLFTRIQKTFQFQNSSSVTLVNITETVSTCKVKMIKICLGILKKINSYCLQCALFCVFFLLLQLRISCHYHFACRYGFL